MRIAVVSVLIICGSMVTTQDHGGSNSCSSEEKPAGETPIKDTFCKPELTHPSQLNKLRHCLCGTGHVRNAWGICITLEECEMCKAEPNHEFSKCETACPATCGELVPSLCTLQCVVGCACPPGYVRGPGKKGCVPVSKCAPLCPPNSTFELCKHGCEPRCGSPPPPDTCVPECSRGQCICKQGYAEAFISGQSACVPRKNCPKPIV
ncbi:serine protease inhibitor swm-1-like [Dermacentor silvarum]|uniref:serine protease inhibitor swm-1-like n=1 Tax=Dermacentor silvarum TaxID=543639 RepID=UPI002100E12E|nr:serine protease inhibitor swm-1-like [Dermacentor silvarum]